MEVNKEEKEIPTLTKEEREVLIEIVHSHMVKVLQEMRQNELIIHNTPLAKQYSDDYLVFLRCQIIEYKAKVRELKILINKIAQEERYDQEEIGK